VSLPEAQEVSQTAFCSAAPSSVNNQRQRRISTPHTPLLNSRSVWFGGGWAVGDGAPQPHLHHDSVETPPQPINAVVGVHEDEMSTAAQNFERPGLAKRRPSEAKPSF
jgi:hypothetical protein